MNGHAIVRSTRRARVAQLVFFATLLAPLARAYPPYHDISDKPAAHAEARERKLPLAYLGSFPSCLTDPSSPANTQSELTQLALNTLQGNAVVIFFDGRNMGPVPLVIHAQYQIPDDGPLPGGAAWNIPKVVFADPGITRALGRVSSTDMEANREASILSALNVIRADPTALAPPAPRVPQLPAADRRRGK